MENTLLPHSCQSLCYRRSQAGVSLVELMISITIGLLLLAGITGMIVAQSSTRAEIDKSGKQIENGRYALTVLQGDIEHAGYYGQYSGSLPPPAAMPDPCATTAAVIDAALALALQGYDAPATVPAPLSACLQNADHIPGTDILVVRRVEAVELPTAVASAVAGQVYMQTTPDSKVVAIGPDTSPSTYTLTKKDGVTSADLLRFVEHIYFLSPCNRYAAGATACSTAADGGQPLPTLKRLELTTVGGATTFTLAPLVEGIEDMQFDYGVDSAGKGVPASPFITAPGLADWPNVMAVQVNLLARNLELSPGYTTDRTYSLGLNGSVGPFTNAYKRHVYSAEVRAINPSGRRE
jgi:type IV pilus assembly protein PilW